MSKNKETPISISEYEKKLLSLPGIAEKLDEAILSIQSGNIRIKHQRSS